MNRQTDSNSGWSFRQNPKGYYDTISTTHFKQQQQQQQILNTFIKKLSLYKFMQPVYCDATKFM